MKNYFQIKKIGTNKIVYEWDISGKSEKQIQLFKEGFNQILQQEGFVVVESHK